MEFPAPLEVLNREILSGVSIGEAVLALIAVIVVVSIINRIQRARMLD